MNAEQLMSSLLMDAIQGKLVPQISSENSVQGQDIEDSPFEIPESWGWFELKDCVQFNPKVSQIDDGDEASFIPMADVEPGYVNKCFTNQIKAWGNIKKGFSRFEDGDVLMAKITPCFQNRKSCIAKNLKNGLGAGSTEFHVMRPLDFLNPQYLLWFTKSQFLIDYGVANFKGTAGQQRIGTQDLKRCLIPVPPLEEQSRIVTRIEELLPLVEAYGKSYDRLQELNAELPGKLKASILQEAIQGKLVPQLDSEEAVEQIGDAPEDVPFAIPEKWKWVQFKHTCNSLDGKRIPLKKDDRAKLKKIYPYYGATGIIDFVDNYIFDGVFLLIGEDGANLLSRSKDNAFIASGKIWVNNHAHVFEENGIADLRYLALVINATSLGPYVTGSAQPKLTQKNLYSIPIPIPPILEQVRIVGKMEELLKQVDALSGK